jgi:hypothetical protein
MFVSADRQVPRPLVTADNQGRFEASLASGSWLVYVEGSDGRPVFQRKIHVRDNETYRFSVVSR